MCGLLTLNHGYSTKFREIYPMLILYAANSERRRIAAMVPFSPAIAREEVHETPNYNQCEAIGGYQRLWAKGCRTP